MLHPANLQPLLCLPRRWELLLSVEMGKEEAGNEIKMGSGYCYSRAGLLIWGACAAPSSPGGRDAHGKLKEKVIFFPQRPPKAARKYMSLLSISHRTGTLQPCQAKSWLNTCKYLETALHLSCVSNHSPTQRETRPTDVNSGLMHTVPQFPHLHTGVNCSALLCEEHQDLPGKDRAPTSGRCVGCWATQHHFEVVADTQHWT